MVNLFKVPIPFPQFFLLLLSLFFPMDASVLLLRLKRKEENNGGCWPQCLTVTLPSGPLTARVHTVEVFAAVHQLRGRQWQCRCCCCCAFRTITMCTFTFAFPVDAAAARRGCCSSSALCKGNRLEARIVGDGDDGLLIVSSSLSVCPSDLPRSTVHQRVREWTR